MILSRSVLNFKSVNVPSNRPSLNQFTRSVYLRCMKACSILFFLILIASQAYAQPGLDVIFPTNIHLNDYPSFSRQVDENGVATDLHLSLLGVITIDARADLSIIPQLKQEKHLSLKIDLPQIPEEFNDFHQTESLELMDLKDSTNISFVNAFLNLKELRIKNCGALLFDEYLKLDSLSTLDISASKNLTHLQAFEKLTSLKEISLRDVPQLQGFPAFDPKNSIRKVYIYFESGNGCTNCPPNPNQLDITALNQLRHLEELDFFNLSGITKIPGDLSPKLKVFRMSNNFRANKQYAIRSQLEDVSNFNQYKQLEVLELSGLGLKAFKGTFDQLNLKRLRLSSMVGLEDLSGIFTMNSIDEVFIKNCNLKSIQGEHCAVNIQKMDIQKCSFIENIDFLLACEHINSLRLGGGSKLMLPKQEKWRIPNLLLFGHGKGGEFVVKMEKGELIEQMNLKDYIR